MVRKPIPTIVFPAKSYEWIKQEEEDLIEAGLLPAPQWLPLLSPLQQGWREKQILKGRNPDPYIEKELRKAGAWPADDDMVVL